ncbi:MAG: type II toxin-antitoxin system RelE/ParE family toxin [Candidatus Dormibacteraceae bacterium]
MPDVVFTRGAQDDIRRTFYYAQPNCISAPRGRQAVSNLGHQAAVRRRPLARQLKAECHAKPARRGPYRIIYSIDDATRPITVIAVAHRADVYRRARRG